MEQTREYGGASLSRQQDAHGTRILLIEDNEDDAVLFREALFSDGETAFDLKWVVRLSAGLHALANGPFDVVMLDLGLPDSLGAETLKRLLANAPDVPVVVMTGLNDAKVGIEMMQIGAQDYLVKGQVEDQILIRTIHYAIERHRLRAQVKQAAHKLQASELRLRTIIEQIADGIIVVDIQGLVRFVNPAAEKMLGHSLFGHSAETLVDQHPGFQVIGQDSTVLDLVGEDGEKRIAEMRVKETIWEGQKAYLATLRDITLRIEAEQMLQAYSERLEEMVDERTRALQDAQEQLVRREKLAVLGQLAGGIGHELRNPLGAIKNAVYYLKMILPEETTGAELLSLLDIINREVESASGIISSLLDYARTKLPHKRPADLNALVKGVVNRITFRDLPQIQLILDLDADIPYVMADQGQITSILVNLVTNAIQAMTPAPSLEYSDKPVWGSLILRTAAENAHWVSVEVIDSGKGITEEHMAKIFEPLFTTKTTGMGLGLALVRIMVEGHGGTVDVVSAVGKGSTFTVRLPVDECLPEMIKEA